MPCMPYPQCSELTADSGHNSYFQQCKCSVLTKMCRERSVENWMPLKQAHWVLNRLIEEVDFEDAIEAGSLSTGSLKRLTLVAGYFGLTAPRTFGGGGGRSPRWCRLFWLNCSTSYQWFRMAWVDWYTLCMTGVCETLTVLSVFFSVINTQFNAFPNRLFQFNCPTNVMSVTIDIMSGSCRASHADMVTRILIVGSHMSEREAYYIGARTSRARPTALGPIRC